jgi:hypothetical protein
MNEIKEKVEELYEYNDDYNDNDSDKLNKQQELLDSFRNSLKSNNINSDNSNNDFIESSSMSPSNAFNIFQGKSLNNNNSLNNDQHITSNTKSLLSINLEEYSLPDSIEKRCATPFQKFAILRADVEDLIIDLNHIVEINNNNNNNKDKLSTSQWSKIQEMTQIKIKEIESKDLNNNNNKNNNNNEILNNLKERINFIEQILDSSPSNMIDNQNPTESLFKKVNTLENKMQFLDPTNLEGIKIKVTNLKKELVITKATNNNIKSVLLEKKILDNKTLIEELNEKVNDVDETLNDIPSIIMRLKSLENIHSSQISISNNMVNIDKKINSTLITVKDNCDVLKILSEGIDSNKEIINSNIITFQKQLNLIKSKI